MASKFCLGGEVCSERYFMDEPLVTWAYGVPNDAENRNLWDLPQVIMKLAFFVFACRFEVALCKFACRIVL